MRNLNEKSIPSNEEIKEFWEWCGFTYIMNYDDSSIIEECRSPIGERLVPTIDLNNLFRYAVPFLFSMGLQTHLASMSSTNHIAKITDAFGKFEDVISVAKDPALALFWALDKVRNDKVS